MTFLAGHPQEWLLLVLALAAWSLFDAVESGASECAASFLPPRLACGAAALSLGLVAIDLAPQLAVRPWLLHDHDASIRVSIPKRYHLEALNGFQLLCPTALGGPADFFGNDNYWETLLSIGFVPLVLALFAARWHRDRKLVRGWLVLIGLALWFACGRHLFLYTAAYFIVPGMNLFRVPARALFLANLAAAVLAGLGVEAIEERLAEPKEWRRFAVRFGVFIVLMVAALFSSATRGRPSILTGQWKPPTGCSSMIDFVLRWPAFWVCSSSASPVFRPARSAAGGEADRTAGRVRARLVRVLTFADIARRAVPGRRSDQRGHRTARLRFLSRRGRSHQGAR